MADAKKSAASQPDQPPLLTDQLFALLRSWFNRLDTLGDLLVAETRLNVKATILLLALLVMTVVVVLSLWFSVLVCLGVIVYSLMHSLIYAVTAVIILQGALLWVLVLSMRHIQSKLGYHHSKLAVAELFGRESQEDSHVAGSASGQLRAEGH